MKYQNMTYEELVAEFEKVKEKLFLLEMKDRWSADDYRQSGLYNTKLCELKRLIDEKTGKGADDGTEIEP